MLLDEQDLREMRESLNGDSREIQLVDLIALKDVYLVDSQYVVFPQKVS